MYEYINKFAYVEALFKVKQNIDEKDILSFNNF